MTAFPGLGPSVPESRGQDGHKYVLWDAAYVLGSLSEVDRSEFEAHLGECASCRDAVTELSGMPALLSLLRLGAHGSHPRSLNAWRGSRPAFFSFSHSLTNLLFSQRRLCSAAHLLTTSSYSPASIISRAISAPRI